MFALDDSRRTAREHYRRENIRETRRSSTASTHPGWPDIMHFSSIQPTWSLRMTTSAITTSRSAAAGTVNLIGHERNETSRTRQTCRQLRHPGNSGDFGPGLKGSGPGSSIAVSWKMIAAVSRHILDNKFSDGVISLICFSEEFLSPGQM